MTLHLDQPTLVMGARGSIGRLVLDDLVRRGVPVRASSRRPAPGSALGGVDVVTADLTDPVSLRPAFEGMRQVFLYATGVGLSGVVDAARSAGVRRIVLMSSGSVVHPASVGNAITEEHRAVEDAFRSAPELELVPVRPLVLASNALGWARSVRGERRVQLYRPDALTAPVHERDVAAVAVAALLGADDVSAMLTGPERLSQRAQVAAVADAIGAEVAVDKFDREAARTRLARFVPEHEAEAVLRFLDDTAAGSSPATGTVEKVLGRPATPFRVWAHDHVAEFA